MYNMTTMTVRALRHNFSEAEEKLSAGERFAIVKRGKTIGYFVPVDPKRAGAVMPDFAERRRALFGDRKLAGNSILAERQEARW